MINPTTSYSISLKLSGIYFPRNESTLSAFDKNFESLIDDIKGTNNPAILFACIYKAPYVAHTYDID